jgi:hypothetical protein
MYYIPAAFICKKQNIFILIGWQPGDSKKDMFVHTTTIFSQGNVLNKGNEKHKVK